MTVLVLLLAIAGFAALGLATPAHHRRWLGGAAAPARSVLRRAGWLALFCALALSVAARGWAFGPVLWTGAIMLGAGCAFLLLNLAPARYERSK